MSAYFLGFNPKLIKSKSHKMQTIDTNKVKFWEMSHKKKDF